MKKKDVLIIGAGHNGLIASILLASAGLSVTVLERSHALGGAVRTEYPFKKAPNLGQSTGAYLLGLMPPEIMEALGVRFPTLRRDPHYFLPNQEEGYLLFGSDKEGMKAQFQKYFTLADYEAAEAMQAELAQLREDLAPSWLQGPLTHEETAEQFIRPALRQVFVDLCRGSVKDYLHRFAFHSPRVAAMYAVTDAFSGSTGGWSTPGSGMNFLVHNMCRLPEADGTWMVVKGGMGTITKMLADRAVELGVEILRSAPVASIDLTQGVATGVTLEDGQELRAQVVLSNADPFTTRDLLSSTALPEEYNKKLDNLYRPGMTMKVNLCLTDLPRFRCLPETVGQHHGTIHLLPEGENVLEEIEAGRQAALSGKLPEFPTIEWYIQTPVDPTLSDEEGNHSSALFVQWVPNEIEGSSWEREAQSYARQLLKICDRFAPGTSDLVKDLFVLHPQAIESHFGIRGGHIHHVDNLFGFQDRIPYATPVDGLYQCSAGCHPAGSVIGAAGHNAARQILKELNVTF